MKDVFGEVVRVRRDHQGGGGWVWFLVAIFIGVGVFAFQVAVDVEATNGRVVEEPRCREIRTSDGPRTQCTAIVLVGDTRGRVHVSTRTELGDEVRAGVSRDGRVVNAPKRGAAVFGIGMVALGVGLGVGWVRAGRAASADRPEA